MANTTLSKTEELVEHTQDDIIELETIEPHPLSENAILLYNAKKEKAQPPKPPPTPKELITDCYITILPTIPDNINHIQIPYVRQVGVRDAIGMLAPFFNCNDYQNNLVEFWFLDILVDCIWRVQDEYSFSHAQQKWVLEWLIFIIKLIHNSKMTKQLMFQIFNEAMLTAEEYVQAGGTEDPIPRKLFIVNLEHDSETPESISSLNTSLISAVNSKTVTKFRPSRQYIVIECDQEYKVFKFPTKEITVDCLSSSIDSASDQTIVLEEAPQTIIAEDSESSVDFGKVDMSTPPRFKSLNELIETPASESSVNYSIYQSESSHTIIGDWHNFPRKISAPSCPSKLTEPKLSLPAFQEHKSETKSSLVNAMMPSNKELSPNTNEIFQAFYEYNLWTLKNEFLDNSKLGWTSFSTNQALSGPIKTEATLHLGTEKQSAEEDNKLFIKSGVLLTIRQIVYDYFEHTFAFDLTRISLASPQFLITQDVNIDWYIPKEFKGDLKKPIPKKPKKEKPKKEPKTKHKKDKTKSSHRSKSSKEKGKVKKSIKSKKDKKFKSDKKSKKTKKSKSSKEGKGKKLSKEEKKDLERQKKEQEELEKEFLRQAEDKMYMFPLKDAVDEQFFLNIFPNYKPGKKGKSGKTEKASKSSKHSKSTKSSKSSKKSKQQKKKK